MNRKTTENFIELLNSYMSTGLSVQSSLEIIAKSEKNNDIKSIALNTLEGVSAGNTFWQSFVSIKGTESIKAFIPFIQYSEEAGELDEAFKYLSSYFSEGKKSKENFLAASLYPIFVLGIVVVVMLVLSFYVFPRFNEIIESISITGHGINIKQSILSLKITGLVILLAIVLICLLFLLYKKNRSVHYKIDKLSYSIGFLKNIRINSDLSVFSFLMATLLKSGERIGCALSTAADTANNFYFAELIENVSEKIAAGENLSDSFREGNILPEIFISRIRLSEESGNLAECFDALYKIFSERRNKRTAVLSKVSEPVLTIITGLIIFLFIIKFALPLFTSFGDII